MNTSMRTILATAAAGALVLGSAGGVATAKPATPKGPKAGYTQLRMIDVHNSPFNVAKARTIKVKANVWDSVKGSDPASVTVTLAQFDKKKSKGGVEIADGLAVIPDQTVVLTSGAKADKKSRNYKGTINAEGLLAELSDAEKTALSSSPVLMCISTVTVDGVDSPKDPKRQVTRKIGNDCFRIVNVAPTVS